MELAVIVVAPFVAAGFISWLLSLNRRGRRLAFFVLSGSYYLFASRPGSIEFEGRTLSYSAHPWLIAPACLMLALGMVTAYYHLKPRRVRHATN